MVDRPAGGDSHSSGVRMGRLTLARPRSPLTSAAPASESRLRLLLDGTRDHAIVTLGPQGMVLTWNAAAQRITGYTTEEIVGQHVSVFDTPEDIAAGRTRRTLAEAAERGSFEDEGWRVRKDGTRFWASVAITPLTDQTGRLRGFAQVTRDLTERVLGQDLLAVFDAASDAIIGVAETGLIISLNATAERMFGYGRTELVGRMIEVLVPGAARAQHAGHRAGYLRDPRARPMCGGADLRGVRQDGTEFPVEVSLSSIDTPRGLVVTATVRDLTERRRAEAALRAARSELERGRALLASAERMVGLGSWELDPEAGRERWSDGLYRLLGLKPGGAEAVDATLLAHLDPADRATFLAGVPTPDRPVVSFDVRLTDADGVKRIVSILRELEYDEDGRAVRHRGTVLDVTRTRTLERVLREALDRYAGLLDAATHQAVITTDRHGRITYGNEGVHRMLGHRPEELVGSQVEALLDPADLGTATAGLRLADGEAAFPGIARAGLPITREWTCRAGDGSRVPVVLTLAAIGDPADPGGFICMATSLARALGGPGAAPVPGT